MKTKPKKTVKKDKKQIVEIHIYIHQIPYCQPINPNFTPNGTGKQPWQPPYEVTCFSAPIIK